MIKKFLAAALATVALASFNAQAESPADLNDLEIAHVAYTANLVDIRYAHLALAKSKSPEIHRFAKTMIRDHSLVNDLALALVKKLDVAPKDNFLSRQMNVQADQLIKKMSALSGTAFDRFYANNEHRYHVAVNTLVGKTFIPNIENAEVKALFEQALAIFTAHEKHAEMMVTALGS